MAEAKKRSTEILLVKYLYSADVIKIATIFSELKKGARLDSLLAGRPEAAGQKTPGKVTYGSLDGFVEDSLYHLKPGQFTAPIYAGSRWYIFKLYGIRRKPYFNTPDNLVKIKRIVERNKSSSLEKKYLRDFLGKFNINVDRRLFTLTAETVKKYLSAKKIRVEKEGDPKFLYLLAGDINSIEDSLGSRALNSVFIKFKTNPETLRQFLEQLKYLNFKIEPRNINAVGNVLDGTVKNYLDSQLLTREGYKLGLEKTARVKRDISVWKTYFLAQKLEKEIYDSINISDEEAYEFFAKNRDVIFKPEEVDLEEIIADNLDAVSEALDNIEKGMPFVEAAEKYCSVDSLKRRGGRLGYLPVNKLGKIGETVLKMKKGEIRGPMKVERGYALIKLIDTRKADTPRDTSFARNKDEIMEVIKRIRLEQKLKDYTANLAVKYGVDINWNVFNSVPVLRINNVTVKMIGFGGRILAFPYSPLFAGWYDVYLNKEKTLVQKN